MKFTDIHELIVKDGKVIGTKLRDSIVDRAYVGEESKFICLKCGQSVWLKYWEHLYHCECGACYQSTPNYIKRISSLKYKYIVYSNRVKYALQILRGKS